MAPRIRLGPLLVALATASSLAAVYSRSEGVALLLVPCAPLLALAAAAAWLRFRRQPPLPRRSWTQAIALCLALMLFYGAFGGFAWGLVPFAVCTLATAVLVMLLLNDPWPGPPDDAPPGLPRSRRRMHCSS